MTKRKLIDYEIMDEKVIGIEKLLSDLDLDSKRLVLDIMKDRVAQQVAKLRTDTYIGGMNQGLFGGLFKKAQRGLQSSDEDE